MPGINVLDFYDYLKSRNDSFLKKLGKFFVHNKSDILYFLEYEATDREVALYEDKVDLIIKKYKEYLRKELTLAKKVGFNYLSSCSKAIELDKGPFYSNKENLIKFCEKYKCIPYFSDIPFGYIKSINHYYEPDIILTFDYELELLSRRCNMMTEGDYDLIEHCAHFLSANGTPIITFSPYVSKKDLESGCFERFKQYLENIYPHWHLYKPKASICCDFALYSGQTCLDVDGISHRTNSPYITVVLELVQNKDYNPNFFMWARFQCGRDDAVGDLCTDLWTDRLWWKHIDLSFKREKYQAKDPLSKHYCLGLPLVYYVKELKDLISVVDRCSEETKNAFYLALNEFNNTIEKTQVQEHRNCLKQRSSSIRELIWKSKDHVCGICHKPILAFEDMHVDHIIPLSRGGNDVYDNLQPSHKHCNLLKHNRLQEELTI